MAYTGTIGEARKLLDDILANRPYDNELFMELHLSRNQYNIGTVYSLHELANGTFRDNCGRIWTRVSSLKNKFHQPLGTWIGSSLGLATPYSYKFLSPDIESGLGGEYEMIIRVSDNKRLDAVAHMDWQETYNFGPTAQFWNHKKLDVDPHGVNPNYNFLAERGYTSVEMR